MNCPRCGCPDYFELISKDCANPGCTNFNNGSTGTRPKADLKEPLAQFFGFTVIRRDKTFPTNEYVFATRADGERWRDLNGLTDAAVRKVANDKPFKWQPSRGTVRGIILADRLYDVYERAPDYAKDPFVCVIDEMKDD